ncbi:MAG TPA: hypothetical protein VF516_03290 [Kofleriaceae bacterium]
METEGKSRKEICLAIGCSPSAVTRHLGAVRQYKGSRVDIEAAMKDAATANPLRSAVKGYLYRYFDGGGVLLYVGISLCAISRLSGHRSSDSWYGEISRVDIEKFPSIDQAKDAERKAIRAEHPKYNIDGVVPAGI